MHARLGADVTETVDVEPIDLNVAAHAGFRFEGIEAVAAVLGSSRAEEMDIAHL